MKKIKIFGYNEKPIKEYVKKKFRDHNGYSNIAMEIEEFPNEKLGPYFYLVGWITPDVHDNDFISGLHFWAGIYVAGSWKDKEVTEQIMKLRNIIRE